ncbi:PH domain-containing protein [uncultured Ruminococcus sp.]|uniref:PH domain-containing protein n=1 Tax=uncultured Ruminococcus sp. TaxID=165186 RepID=UPI002607515D|nr:PH domain-containing protein [uncultured Ruminococcus sp.]
MIDFNNKSIVKMKKVADNAFFGMIQPIMVDGETIIGTYQSMRDGVVFTNMRIIAINVQGVTGKKKDFTSIPYSKIQVFSTETSGVFDLDSELEIWLSGVGKVKFEFTGSSDICAICKVIGTYALK